MARLVSSFATMLQNLKCVFAVSVPLIGLVLLSGGRNLWMVASRAGSHKASLYSGVPNDRAPNPRSVPVIAKLQRVAIPGAAVVKTKVNQKKRKAHLSRHVDSFLTFRRVHSVHVRQLALTKGRTHPAGISSTSHAETECHTHSS